VGITGVTPATGGRAVAPVEKPRVDVEAINAPFMQSYRDIQSQREGLATNRANLAAQLGTFRPDRKGRLPPQAAMVQQQIRGIDQQSRNLDAQERQIEHARTTNLHGAFKNAASADKAANDQLHQTAASHGAAVQNGVTQMISNGVLPGSPRFDQGIRDLDTQYPLWRRNTAAASYVGKLVGTHDQQVVKNLAKSQDELQKATGLTPAEFGALADKAQAGVIVQPPTSAGGTATIHTGRGGFDAQGRPKGTFSTETAPFLPEQYKNTPWEQVPQDVKNKMTESITRGGAMQIDTGKGYPVVIPRQQFESFRQQFAQRPTGIVEQPPPTAPEAAGLQPAPAGASAAESVSAGIARRAIVLSPEQAAARAARGEVSAPAPPPVAAAAPPDTTNLRNYLATTPEIQNATIGGAPVAPVQPTATQPAPEAAAAKPRFVRQAGVTYELQDDGTYR
jgi:hypothetical protein